MTTTIFRRTAPTVRRRVAMLTTALSAATILTGCATGATLLRASSDEGNITIRAGDDPAGTG